MPAPDNPLRELLPADLTEAIPRRIRQALPGGLRNRAVQVGLGLLIAFGLAFLVRRWIDRRDRKRALERAAVAAPLPPVAPLAPEPRPLPDVAPAMTDTNQASDIPDGHVARYPLLGQPHVTLSGPVDQAMYQSFRDQLAHVPAAGTIVITLSTLGGDPEVARLMGDEVRLLREYRNREILFLGKVAVYSAGATFMAAFPVDKRFLTKGTRIMVHERIMSSTIALSGPLKSLVATIRAKLHEIEHSVLIEEEGFRDLVAGSKISFEEVRERAPSNWYIEAEEARDLGLVLDVI